MDSRAILTGGHRILHWELYNGPQITIEPLQRDACPLDLSATGSRAEPDSRSSGARGRSWALLGPKGPCGAQRDYISYVGPYQRATKAVCQELCRYIPYI